MSNTKLFNKYTQNHTMHINSVVTILEINFGHQFS